jgi:hypothetical protein
MSALELRMKLQLMNGLSTGKMPFEVNQRLRRTGSDRNTTDIQTNAQTPLADTPDAHRGRAPVCFQTT